MAIHARVSYWVCPYPYCIVISRHVYGMVRGRIQPLTRVCGYAYVLHLTNAVLVQLFCAAILTLRVWFSAVRVQVQVEYALKARCENVRNWIFEWGFCIGGFCGWSLNRLFRISGLVESNLDYHNRPRSNSTCH